MASYDHKSIEAKWQKRWNESGIYNVEERDSTKEKEYVLIEWPYPSGNLHIGHWFAFAVVDIYVRFRRMLGKQVLFPIGFDAFGLPAENAAIKNKLNPKEWTEKNIAHMTTQLQSMGNAFTWNRSVSSTDPGYYKWTQWMFTKFFEKGIAYRGKGIVNWCPSCHTVLANEQVLSDDTCERCGHEVEKKEMDEWKLRITEYADRLIDDLDSLDWPAHIKESQKNWIGRSRGAVIPFALSNGDTLEVFTTRSDTLFGATYLVLAPEHPIVEEVLPTLENAKEVRNYQMLARKKSDADRANSEREKTGVVLLGITATNPATKEAIPVYIADYVLAHYGTGAIMAVPAHDERDFAFAKIFNIPIADVMEPLFVEKEGNRTVRVDVKTIEREAVTAIVRNPKNDKYLVLRHKNGWETFVNGGVERGETPEEAARKEVLEETGYRNLKLVKELPKIHAHFYHNVKEENRLAHFHNFLFDLENEEQIAVSENEKVLHQADWLSVEEMERFNLPEGGRYIWNCIEDVVPYVGHGILKNSGGFTGLFSETAKEAITKEVDGVISNTYRLRDWSIGRQRYWGVPIPIVYDPEGKAHPVPEEHLPWLLPEDVDFTPTGEPPLAKSEELQKRTEEIFGAGWTPEVETMDTFVDSSWYFLRYLDPTNANELSSLEAQKKWMPIDVYFGGAEHTTMHLLYSRFWQKALFDLGLVTVSEPYTKRINRGLVLGPDGNKMSKSKGNVIDPDEQVERLGADTVKMYLAFMGPYGESVNYPWNMGGIAGIRRFLERVATLSEKVTERESEETEKLLHKTIKKVTEDIELYKFNTAISALMVFINEGERAGLSKSTYQIFLRLLAPFAPHITEELWEESGKSESIHKEEWPVYDETKVIDSEVTIAIQVNGKVRGKIEVGLDSAEEDVRKAAEGLSGVQKYLSEGEIKKVIFVPNKLISYVVEKA